MQYEVFMAGTRADNSGKTVTITPDDVANIAKSYHPNFHEAPIVIGHPSDNAPAFGWVKSLSAQDGKLFAEFGEMDDDFVELVKAGRYKKVSASFYPPNHPSNPKPESWYLRHIGFLGALPPAVKGLSPVSFNDSSDGIVSFGELSESEKLIFDIKSVFARFFNFSETPVSQDDNLNPSVSTDEPSKTDTSGDKSDNPNPTPNNQSENTMNQDVTEALARAEKAEAELAKFKAEQAKKERDLANTQNANFAETLVKDGKIKPCDKELLTQVLNFAEFPNDTTADFGEGDDKKPLAVAFKEFLGNLPKQHSHLTDKVTKSTVNFSESLSHHERAVALMKSENISYEEAARRTA